MGLTIGSKNTKILVVRPTSSSSTAPRSAQLERGREPVKVVEDFEYQGGTFTRDCSMDQETDRRISKAAHTFRRLYRVVWCRKSLKEDTKLRLFKAVVLPTLMYGSETWVTLATHMKHL